MKKIISFILLFIPWLFSIFFLFYHHKITYCIISIIFYFLYTLYIFKIIQNNTYNDKLLPLCLFYIVNQSFNIVIFYYNNIILNFSLGLAMIFIFFKTIKNT